jgi:SAM-dependent methyltransferase
VASLEHLAGGDTAAARRLADEAAALPDAGALARALAARLGRPDSASPYETAEAFRAFIDGGGNPALYRAVVSHLADVYRRTFPETVLDLGCGDARVPVGAVQGLRTPPRLDLVEPSGELLARAEAASRDAGLDARLHPTTAEDFLAGTADRPGWDIAQASFALHAIEPDARREVLTRLRHVAGVVVVIEFDVPDLVHAGEPHLRSLVDRYERGVGEYPEHSPAIDGFLMPVLIGQLSDRTPRATWEQPARRWAAELESAGLHVTATRMLHRYWWAPVCAIHAVAPRGNPPAPSERRDRKCESR